MCISNGMVRILQVFSGHEPTDIVKSSLRSLVPQLGTDPMCAFSRFLCVVSEIEDLIWQSDLLSECDFFLDPPEHRNKVAGGLKTYKFKIFILFNKFNPVWKILLNALSYFKRRDIIEMHIHCTKI